MTTEVSPHPPAAAERPAVRRPAAAPEERWYSAANLISFSRLPMALALWFVGEDAIVFGIIVVAAALSDGLDGFVARIQKRDLLGEPDRGMGVWLDPLCDKVFIVSAVGAACHALGVPIWMGATLLAREILLTLSAVVRRRLPAWRRTRGLKLRAVLAGKATTAAQFLTLLAIALEHASAVPLAGIAGVLGAIAALHYTRLTSRMAAPDPDPTA